MPFDKIIFSERQIYIMPRIPRAQRIERRKVLSDLEERSRTVYPGAKKMMPSTRARGVAWRAKDRLAMLRKPAPEVFSDYRAFYRGLAPKLAEAHSRKGSGPVVIMVGGIAGGGKTTIAGRLALVAENLFPDRKANVKVVSLDSYFKPRANVKVKSFGRARQISRIGVIETKQGPKGGRVIDGEFDNPRASDLKRAIEEISRLRQGGTIETSQRDVSTGQTSKKEIDGSKIDFIIVEGLYTLHSPLARLGDLRIGVQASLGQQFLVRASRDITARQREPTDVARKFAERAPYQRAFVVPTLGNADMVMDVEKAGLKPGSRDPAKAIQDEIWAMSVKESPMLDVFIEDIGLDHARNRWRKLAENEAKKPVPSIILGANDFKRLSRANSLGTLDKERNATGLLANTMLADPYWKVRQACAKSLETKHLRKALPAAMKPAVMDSLKKAIFSDADWRVRAQAVSSHAHIFGKEAFKDLVRVLNEGGNERLAAGQALDYLGFFRLGGVPAPELLGKLKDRGLTLYGLEEEAAKKWGYKPKEFD
jgi:uridine kinase